MCRDKKIGILCPTVTYDGTSVTITDDYGGMVTFTPDQWEVFVNDAESGSLTLE